MSAYRIEELSPESLRQIYEEHMKADFPEDELRSLSTLLEKQAERITVAYGWKREGRLCAYAILTQPEQKQPYGEDSYVLLDYYAVCRGFRGQGVGSVFLETLLEGLVCKGVLFEVEDPEAAKNAEDQEIRKRRIKFYERLGCRLVEGVRTKIFGVDFRLLVWSRQEIPSPFTALLAMEQIYHQLLPPKIFEKNCRFWREGERDETV
ncbi:MAG: GNAT family N-acetyltransferase [Lachnospiraceae bacterium]|nr:GNAT family N-acetyltransferase [Lachnospiraceae bacterium]